jgi:hypothetical protein
VSSRCRFFLTTSSSIDLLVSLADDEDDVVGLTLDPLERGVVSLTSLDGVEERDVDGSSIEASLKCYRNVRIHQGEDFSQNIYPFLLPDLAVFLLFVEFSIFF